MRHFAAVGAGPIFEILVFEAAVQVKARAAAGVGRGLQAADPCGAGSGHGGVEAHGGSAGAPGDIVEDAGRGRTFSPPCYPALDRALSRRAAPLRSNLHHPGRRLGREAVLRGPVFQGRGGGIDGDRTTQELSVYFVSGRRE